MILGPFLLSTLMTCQTSQIRYLKILLFVDDSSIIITKPNTLAFMNKINKVLTDINEWIKANLFSLNVDKNNFIKFSTKNISLTNLNIIYDDKGISIISNMNFLE